MSRLTLLLKPAGLCSPRWSWRADVGHGQTAAAGRVPTRRDDHRANSRRDESRTADVPGARRAVPQADRGVRQSRACDQRHRPGQSERAGGGRRARSPRQAGRRLSGPLHCIPAIVKDNFETIGLQSAAGSLSLKGFVSTRDAFQVKRIKAAGAIVLAKSNMAEFAFTPYETVSSILPGYTKNPYALDRVTAGSSGGTAAAVAANFGAIGLGSDTATRFAARRLIRRSPASARRWASPAVREWSRSTCSPTSPAR